MSNAVVVQETKLPNMQAGAPVRAIVPQDFEGAWRIASAICKAGMAPRGLDQPEKAMVAIMHGLEVGLTPMNALQSIAVVNGRPTIWGDGAIGLARASGLLEWMEEKFEGEGDSFTAICIVKRKGEPKPMRGDFSVGNAKKAGLWGKRGKQGEPTPWITYPERMLKMRARAFALRDAFADVLKGLSIREEVQDYQQPGQAAEPTDEPPAPPPAPKAIVHVNTTGFTTNEVTAQAASSEAGNGIPPHPPLTDVKAVMEWVDGVLSEAETGDQLEDRWNEIIDPVLREMFPPDAEEAMGLYRKHEARLS
jgi:hypothetical protein